MKRILFMLIVAFVAEQVGAANIAVTAVDATLADGLAISGAVNLVYSPIDSGSVSLEINGQQVLSSQESGTYLWLPQTSGTYTITHRAGDHVFTRTIVHTGENDAKEVVEYQITYLNTKSAVNPNATEYSSDEEIVFTALNDIPNYGFVGWTPTSIPVGSTGDKIVTANWNWVPTDGMVEASITGAKPLSIKADWAKTELNQRFGAGKSKVFCEKFGGDFAAALTKKTGKRDGANNELSVWHDYVAGTDPTDSNSVFRAKVTMVNGLPVVEWDPNLNSNGEERVYTVYGKNALSDSWHSPTNANDHFFKVDVAMPPEGTVTFDLGGAIGSVDPVSVRVGQPVGDLPTPPRDGYEFLGWFTMAGGGEIVTSDTIVTADLTIYAHWKSVVKGKSKTIDGYLSGSDTLLLEGVKISDVTNITAFVGGAHVNNKTPLKAATYHIVRTAQTIDVQFQVLDGSYVKCVMVTLSQVNCDVYGKVSQSGWYAEGVSYLGADFTKLEDSKNGGPRGLWNNGDIATSETTSGYGVKNLTLEYWQ